MLSHLPYLQNLGPPSPSPSAGVKRAGRRGGAPRRPPAWEAVCALPIARGWAPCELRAGARPSPWVPAGLDAWPDAPAPTATVELEDGRALTIDDLLEGYVAPVGEGSPRVVEASAWTGPAPEELRALVAEVAALREAAERGERERRAERAVVALGFVILIALALGRPRTGR